MTNLTNLLAVAAGGAVGASLRYGCGIWLTSIFGRGFPYATFSVNILGSFLLGFLGQYLIHKYGVTSAITLGITVGLLGGFTTFSTFSLDALYLLQQQKWSMVSVYILGSVILSLLAAALGFYLGKFING